ncbi:MAG: ribosome biogenesis GTP-binding protein YihA/YsxC [Lachnospiraceae bacterium]|nr:ribosome biogenesis GTP-binding protein YihA/YsxC [Lachnospiraceae bacterium]
MIIKNVELEHVVGVTTKKLPDTNLPEIAFAGRSNVGKSSLINALIQRKAFARTSSTPGKTQTMNFYKVSDALYFVDLPGYGYANVGSDFRKSWGPMIERYLKNSANLKTIFLLLDVRRTPNADDIQMYEWIKASGFEPVIIVTKTDKLKRSQIPKAVKEIRNAISAGQDTKLYLFSAINKAGRDEIMEEIDNIAGQGGKEDDKD